jgi:hypothetical protein
MLEIEIFVIYFNIILLQKSIHLCEFSIDLQIY